jgi:hypothetical protein
MSFYRADASKTWPNYSVRVDWRSTTGTTKDLIGDISLIDVFSLFELAWENAVASNISDNMKMIGNWREQANALSEIGRGTKRIAVAALNVRNVRGQTGEVVG